MAILIKGVNMPGKHFIEGYYIDGENGKVTTISNRMNIVGHAIQIDEEETMKKVIRLTKWIIIVNAKENGNRFVEDNSFATKEEAEEYGKAIEKSGKFEVVNIRPIQVFVDVEMRGNALFIDDHTIIFQKEET